MRVGVANLDDVLLAATFANRGVVEIPHDVFTNVSALKAATC
jgi:hypothetical protein